MGHRLAMGRRCYQRGGRPIAAGCPPLVHFTYLFTLCTERKATVRMVLSDSDSARAIGPMHDMISIRWLPVESGAGASTADRWARWPWGGIRWGAHVVLCRAFPARRDGKRMVSRHRRASGAAIVTQRAYLQGPRPRRHADGRSMWSCVR